MTSQRDPKDTTPEPKPEKEGEVWRKIDSEAETLRRRTTPTYMKQRIMDALPDEPPKPWYKRIFKKN
jgi:hypothetical protein